jgi:hypothetical protein
MNAAWSSNDDARVGLWVGLAASVTPERMTRFELATSTVEQSVALGAACD